MAALPKVQDAWRDGELAARYERLIAVRGEVSKALELARRDKVIGHSLDASVNIAAPEELAAFIEGFQPELNRIFIVSKAVVVGAQVAEAGEGEPTLASEQIEGLKLWVSSAPGEKCERCWNYDEATGSNDKGHAICPRCYDVVEGLG